MRALFLFGICALYACTPSADNNNTRQASPDAPITDGKTDPTPTPTPTPTETATPDPGSGGTTLPPVEEPQLKDCTNTTVPGSAHAMSVLWDKDSSQYKVDFVNAADRSAKIIALYVTGKDDSVPVFPKFEFKGTAYWMVVVDDPFEQFFNLPATYGVLPTLGLDVTKNYGGAATGSNLWALKSAACIKVSVITFDEDADPAFQTSAFLQVHRP